MITIKVNEAGHNTYVDNETPLLWILIVGSDIFKQTTPSLIYNMMPDSISRFIKNITTSLAVKLMPRFIHGTKAVLGAGSLPYQIININVKFINNDPGITLCWWRSVAHSSNCFAVESFINRLVT